MSEKKKPSIPQDEVGIVKPFSSTPGAYYTNSAWDVIRCGGCNNKPKPGTTCLRCLRRSAEASEGYSEGYDVQAQAAGSSSDPGTSELDRYSIAELLLHVLRRVQGSSSS